MKVKSQKKNQVFSIALMSVLAFAIVLVADNTKEAISAISGTMVDISGSNAETYQVKELYETDEGGHTVLATAKGFNTDVDIEVLVTFDEAVENVLAVEVISQAETDGLGSKITEEDFTGKFADIIAPVKIADLEIASPVTGSVGVGTVSTSSKDIDNRRSPVRWNPSDESAEANAFRNLYDAGLLLSEDNKEELKTAKVDMTPQEIAVENMKEAGLISPDAESVSTSTVSTPEGRAIVKLSAAGLLRNNTEPAGLVVTAEDRAAGKLEGVGLTSSKEESIDFSSGPSVEVTNIDAITGATVSSEAVGEAVNNAYFFLKESIIG